MSDEDYYTFWVYDTQADISQRNEFRFHKSDEFKDLVLKQKTNLQKYNVQAAVFYRDINTNKWSDENCHGGYFNICYEVKHLAFRCFVFMVLKWLNDQLDFYQHINGIVFNCKKCAFYVQIWVNDGFISRVLQKRYEEVVNACLLELRPSNESRVTQDNTAVIEFFPQSTYKEESPTAKQEKEKSSKPQNKKNSSIKTFACKVKPFAQCLQEISPDILQIPKSPVFDLKAATIHKVSWSERRKSTEGQQ